VSEGVWVSTPDTNAIRERAEKLDAACQDIADHDDLVVGATYGTSTTRRALREDIPALCDALDSEREYAQEGWAWVDEMLRLGGWRDVFQACDALRAQSGDSA
jgi:hypothetical protein